MKLQQELFDCEKFQEKLASMLHCIRLKDLDKENISQEKVGMNINTNQRTIGRMESCECTSWHTLLNVYYYYRQFEGIKERYDSHFQKLYKIEAIPDRVIMQLQDRNYDKSKIEENFRKIYEEALEICEIDFFHLATERQKMEEAESNDE
ncbi:hypothetical protein [uncultured Bacteroides sp.]|uniref:hypothetical protein n=1 Tax=uncultured Bacteroides sp. TaxID=162156 RepID=UPI002AABD1B5|nr:hypothetical protein [uncultured Bacteroides sp.]